MLRKDAKVRRSFLWRLTIVILLVALMVISYEWYAILTHQTNEEDPVAEYYAEVSEPGPWQEVERVSSRDARVDAVVVKNSDRPGERYVLCVVPAGKLIEKETPYRSHVIYLKRLVSKAPFVAVNVEGLRLAWTGENELSVSGDRALIYGKKPTSQVVDNGTVRTVNLRYEFRDSRFSNSFGVDWESL